MMCMFSCSSTKQMVTDYPLFSKNFFLLQKKERCGFAPEDAYKQRKKIRDKILFIDYSSDTIYILKSFVMSEGAFYEAIWTDKGRLEFKWNNLNYEIGSNYFIKRLYKLIENWDIETIKQEEKDHGDISDGSPIMGVRLIIENGIMRMDCIAFQEFFDVSKDQ